MWFPLQVLLPALVLYQLIDNCECQTRSRPALECYKPATCPCCNPGTCPSNRSGQCGGNCLDGYHGGKCRNRCPTNCVSCKDAARGRKVSVCTQCKEGYYSTPALYQCQRRCHGNCKTCESSRFKCTSCKTGYYVSTSQKCLPCDQGCLMCNSSSSQAAGRQ